MYKHFVIALFLCTTTLFMIYLFRIFMCLCLFFCVYLSVLFFSTYISASLGSFFVLLCSVFSLKSNFYDMKYLDQKELCLPIFYTFPVLCIAIILSITM